MQIDTTNIIGRIFFTHDPKTRYVVRGLVVNGTVLILGEYTDQYGKETRMKTFKLEECHFPITDPAPSPAPAPAAS